jgi:hypothetical protein
MKMKIWHFLVLVFAIILALMVVHYFSHHQGQSAVGAFVPGK